MDSELRASWHEKMGCCELFQGHELNPYYLGYCANNRQFVFQ